MRIPLGFLVVFAGCKGSAGDTASRTPTWDRGPNPHALDEVLRFNHVQAKGTHNSTHLEPAAPVDPSHRYSHPTLTEQLDQYHVRQLELDLHLRDDGSWEVFHLPVIDEETSCRAFLDCLGEIRSWSDAHGWHLPIVVWLEPKDELDALLEGYRSIGDELPTVDDDIRSVFPDERLFTPDDLRGDHPDLPTALAIDGWPTLGEVRGSVVFALLDSGVHRQNTVADNPTLEGRVLFADTSSVTDPWAALVKDGSPAQITEWVQSGFAITTNGSAATDTAAEAEAEDLAALAAGVTHLATDMAAPEADYWLDLPPRCNPITAPPDCDDAEIEILE